MQSTPKSSRLHIAIFGRRNAGKSSLINAITKQDIAVVSEVAGTTTDPVYKNMEILPIGPVVLIDTAGIDDVGDLGQLRIKKTYQVLRKTDVALLVIDPEKGIDEFEEKLIKEIKDRKLPLIGVINKVDIRDSLQKKKLEEKYGIPFCKISAKTGEGIEKLKQVIIRNAPKGWDSRGIIGDLIKPGDTVVLVVPIDYEAPKGRLILPQVQTIRDILDNDCCAVMVKETELAATLDNLKAPPKLVVTDSQAFDYVYKILPEDIPLTSFSILFARFKGDFKSLIEGAKHIDKLKPGDNILIAESCTHHPIKDDIGRVKIPNWLRQKVGGELNFEWYAGGDFPEDLSKYDLVIQCGGCMVNRKEILYRISKAREANKPIVNYGILIAKVHGILERALAPFRDIEKGI